MHVTPEQASAASSLQIGYQNAIVIAPEWSRLTVFLNDVRLIDEPVQSSDTIKKLSVDLPAGVLKPGANNVRIAAQHRHRTDCNIESTYDLWSKVDPASSFLTLPAATAAPTDVDGIRALGADETGWTNIRMIVPRLPDPGTAASLIRLAESLALLSDMPNQSVTISDTPFEPSTPGALNVVFGLSSSLRDILTDVPQEANTGPVAKFVDDPRNGPSTLVVTAPTSQQLASAVESIAATVDRPASLQETHLASTAWWAPDIPLFLSGQRASLSDLGIPTQEFSGRRFRAEFAIGFPADFFASDYGEARLLLDAAYTQEVLPGSHIDVYVNGNVAATVPITVQRGAILRHFPIDIPLRNVRPGANVLAIEAVLRTAADQVCLPGAPAIDAERFVLFDTTEFVVPSYARIGRRPSLAGLAASGFPYALTADPIPLILTPQDLSTYSAAATLLARLSVAVGRPISVQTAVSPAGVGDRDAIFVGPIHQLPPGILQQVGLADSARVAWAGSPGREVRDAAAPDTAATFERWRRDLSRDGGWRGQVSSFEDWLKRTFDISFSSLRLLPGKDQSFLPSNGSNLVVAQGVSPSRNRTWTVVSVPNDADISEGVRSLVGQERWAMLTGRITAYSTDRNIAATTVPVGAASVVFTEPLSLNNLRLIAANWLSAHVLSYSFLLAVASIFNGIATAALLASFGRRP